MLKRPTRSVKNQYLGINAHLHSFWQRHGGWSSFHTRHIVHLADTLKAQLLPMGYTSELEPSLQIRNLDYGETADPESDVTIYDLDPARAAAQPAHPASGGAAVGEAIMTIPEALKDARLSDKDYKAVHIYELKPNRLQRGDPVAWIELLSPSNKPGGSHPSSYVDKRLAIIETGIVFVEIDYLHESAPTFKGVQRYRLPRSGHFPSTGHAYRISVIDPRPIFDVGTVRVSEFDADILIPTVNIPLNRDDVLRFDFGVPYRKTYEESLYGLELVDYTRFPDSFHSFYSPGDQTRIARRMLAVLEAAASGADPEAAPFAVKEVTLEDALAQIQALTDAIPQT